MSPAPRDDRRKPSDSSLGKPKKGIYSSLPKACAQAARRSGPKKNPLVAHISRGPYLPSFGRCGAVGNSRTRQNTQRRSRDELLGVRVSARSARSKTRRSRGAANFPSRQVRASNKHSFHIDPRQSGVAFLFLFSPCLCVSVVKLVPFPKTGTPPYPLTDFA